MHLTLTVIYKSLAQLVSTDFTANRSSSQQHGHRLKQEPPGHQRSKSSLEVTVRQLHNDKMHEHETTVTCHRVAVAPRYINFLRFRHAYCFDMHTRTYTYIT